jgi:hypothetical protein
MHNHVSSSEIGIILIRAKFERLIRSIKLLRDFLLHTHLARVPQAADMGGAIRFSDIVRHWMASDTGFLQPGESTKSKGGLWASHSAASRIYQSWEANIIVKVLSTKDTESRPWRHESENAIFLVVHIYIRCSSQNCTISFTHHVVDCGAAGA